MMKIQSRKRLNRCGMTMTEYAVLIAVLIAALLAVQVFLKRAICYRWRSSADVFGGGQQYEPGQTSITSF